MKLSKRILACAITAAMATSMLSACNGSTTTSGSASDAGTSQGNSSTTENSNSGDNSSTDGNGGSNGGNIVEAPSNGAHSSGSVTMILTQTTRKSLTSSMTQDIR